MMDELELLKKDWQKKEAGLPKLSFNDIYTMIWKRSSSIVRWILIISILELLLPNLLVLLFPDFGNLSFKKNLGSMYGYYLGFSIFYYAVVLIFIFLFYKRYKDISALDDSRNLMRKILNTRKTVKCYIVFCLLMCLVFFGVFITGFYFDDTVLLSIEGVAEKTKEIPLPQLRNTLAWTIALAGVLFTVLMGGIYFLLYGLLLRKLNKNYKDLKQLEV